MVQHALNCLVQGGLVNAVLKSMNMVEMEKFKEPSSKVAKKKKSTEPKAKVVAENEKMHVTILSKKCLQAEREIRCYLCYGSLRSERNGC